MIQKWYQSLSESMDKRLWKSSFYVETFLPVRAKLNAFLFSGASNNVFLNFCSERSSRIEKIGNFFLIPHQYLFEGRRVKFIGEQVKFTYIYGEADSSIIKTAGAIVAIIPGDIVGYVLKKVAFHCSKETSLKHKQMVRALNTTQVELVDYSKYGIKQLFTNEPALCQRIDYGLLSYQYFVGKMTKIPSQLASIQHGKLFSLTKRQKAEVAALKCIAEVFIENKIPFWLDCGTCIGAYRNQRMVPWDLDIDIAIPQCEFQNAHNSLKVLKKMGFEVQDASPREYNHSYLILYLKETGTQIDINIYQLDTQASIITYFYPHENGSSSEWWKATDRMHVIPFAYTDIFPLRPTTFEDIKVFVPNKLKEFLLDKYAKSAGGRNSSESNLLPPYVWNPLSNKWEKIKDNVYWKECPVELVLASK